MLSAINAAGYNASINQTIIGGLAAVGSAVESAKLDRRVIRNIVVSWGWRPVLGIGSPVVASLVLHAIFGQ